MKFSEQNYKKRICGLCFKSFTPNHPRLKACYKCRNRGCIDCGKKIVLNFKRERTSNRRCMKCYSTYLPFGSRRKSRDGYISIKTKKGWMLEHRYLMEQKLHRKLKSREHVHHKDGNPGNNVLSNLVVCKNLRDHLDTYHKDDLKNPPLHHFGNRKWTDKDRNKFNRINNKRKDT